MLDLVALDSRVWTSGLNPTGLAAAKPTRVRAAAATVENFMVSM